jgi:hypothetical protein
MKDFCPYVQRLDITVPNSIVDEYYKCIEFLKNSNHLVIKNDRAHLITYFLQAVKPNLQSYLKMYDKNPLIIQNLENWKSFNVWIDECPSIVIIRDFLTSYFSSCFHARASILDANTELGPDSPHEHPRIFIPLNESNTYYWVKENNVKYELKFEMGHMYFWDVRKMHGIHNYGDDRVAASISIDPKLETITKIKGY